MDLKAQIAQKYPDWSWETVEEAARLLAPSRKKCAGNRPQPCGKSENCKGSEKGFRCAAHEDKEIRSDGHVVKRRSGQVGERHWVWE
jgi:hypothetical protein